MRVHAMQGDTVDLLCWRHLGSTAGLVERTYLLNPGLAERGPCFRMAPRWSCPR